MDANKTNEAPKNRPTEFFWPNIKRWLSKHEGDQPIASCPICRQDMEIKGIDPAAPISPLNGHGDDAKVTTTTAAATTTPTTVAAAVLPCGHMLCHDCVLNCIREISERFPCPVCRAQTNLPSSSCRHNIHYHVPAAATEIPDCQPEIQVLLTIPEGGRMVDRCLGCFGSTTTTTTEEEEGISGHLHDCCYYKEISDLPRNLHHTANRQPELLIGITYDTTSGEVIYDIRLGDTSILFGYCSTLSTVRRGLVDFIRNLRIRSEISLDEYEQITISECLNSMADDFIVEMDVGVQAGLDEIPLDSMAAHGGSAQSIPILVYRAGETPYMAQDYWPGYISWPDRDSASEDGW